MMDDDYFHESWNLVFIFVFAVRSNLLMVVLERMTAVMRWTCTGLVWLPVKHGWRAQSFTFNVGRGDTSKYSWAWVSCDPCSTWAEMVRGLSGAHVSGIGIINQLMCLMLLKKNKDAISDPVRCLLGCRCSTKSSILQMVCIRDVCKASI